MAEKKIEELKVNEETGEVVETTKKTELEDFDAYERQKKREKLIAEGELFDTSSEGDLTVYVTPYRVQRYDTGYETKDGDTVYSYATGFSTVIKNRKISTTIFLEPSVKDGEYFRYLDTIFDGGEAVPLEVVRTRRTRTENGRNIVSYTYAFRVSGFGLQVTLTPTRGNNDKKEVFINKMKAQGYVE
ncbi:MAG: hypothetical protein IJ038_05170 [Clostridia bacterium]|nr:hypothetical protein [Clostridia bacterium]